MNIYTTTGILKDLLFSHEMLKTQQEEELAKIPKGELGIRPSRKKGEVYYYRTLDGKRKSLTNDMETAKLLARKKYLTASLNMLEKDIEAIKHLIAVYIDLDHKSIAGSFPPEYAGFMIEPETLWDQKKRKWMAETFPQSTYKVENREHLTAKGLAVRSKSEVIIADRLDYYDIAYRYEQMMYIQQYSFAPDFTILTKRGSMWWEHCGRVNDPEYMRKHNWKIQMYERVGIVPWKNLIVTYDNENGNLDTRIIESEITNKILPYC